jgi:hypothetical protein
MIWWQFYYLDFIFCVSAMYSGEYDACDVTLSVYPHRAGLKNMPGHGGLSFTSIFHLICFAFWFIIYKGGARLFEFFNWGKGTGWGIVLPSIGLVCIRRTRTFTKLWSTLQIRGLYAQGRILVEIVKIYFKTLASSTYVGFREECRQFIYEV